MQPAGVHAVNDMAHTSKHASRPQRSSYVHPTGVNHHPHGASTAQLRDELPHTILHLEREAVGDRWQWVIQAGK